MAQSTGYSRISGWAAPHSATGAKKDFLEAVTKGLSLRGYVGQVTQEIGKVVGFCLRHWDHGGAWVGAHTDVAVGSAHAYRWFMHAFPVCSPQGFRRWIFELLPGEVIIVSLATGWALLTLSLRLHVLNPGNIRQLQAPTSESSFCFYFVWFFCCCCHLRLSFCFLFFLLVKGGLFCKTTDFGGPAHIKGCMLLKTPITLPYFASQPLSVLKILQLKYNASECRVLVYLDIPMQKNGVGPLTHTMHQVNSRGVIDLNVRGRTVRLIKENIRVNICDLGLNNSFFIWHQKHTQNKRYIGLTKIKIVGAANGGIKKTEKTAHRTRENICKFYIQ